MANKFLDPETFNIVIASTPLVAIDLIVLSGNRILVGRRINKPAAGTYFVPGGRIYKGEKLDEAFRRISALETGLKLDRSDCRFLGIFDHIYEDSHLDDGTGAHYVCLAFVADAGHDDLDFDLLRQQHDDVRLVELHDAVDDAAIHENTRAYVKALLTGFEEGPAA